MRFRSGVCAFFFSVLCNAFGSRSNKHPFARLTFTHTNMATSTVNVTLLINDYQFNINSISMYYNQTILNSDRYSLYITIIKSDNNMTTEALKHYKGGREREREIEVCRWILGGWRKSRRASIMDILQVVLRRERDCVTIRREIAIDIRMREEKDRVIDDWWNSDDDRWWMHDDRNERLNGTMSRGDQGGEARTLNTTVTSSWPRARP